MYKMKEPHPPQTHSSFSSSSLPPYRPHIEMMRRSAHKRVLALPLLLLRVVSQPLSLTLSRVHSWNNLSANHRPRQPFDLTSFCRLAKFPPLFYRSSARQSMITAYSDQQASVSAMPSYKIVQLYRNSSDFLSRRHCEKLLY